MQVHTTWLFPHEIEFQTATELTQRLCDLAGTDNTVIFDLSKTKSVHSSFVGFLIHTKNYLESNGMRLVLRTSPQIDKVLALLNLGSYFRIESSPGAEQATLQ
jgi:anti-anti-sigma regulatory factor